MLGETAAALASASIVFYETDREYSELLIGRAKDLFDFAAVYKGSYHDSIKPAGKAYRLAYINFTMILLGRISTG